MNIYDLIFWIGLAFFVFGCGCLSVFQARLTLRKGILDSLGAVFSGDLTPQEKGTLKLGFKCLALSLICFAIGLLLRGDELRKSDRLLDLF
ncbi:MAG: hypothetical protein M0P70_16370 [Desulfobulbaceae bacterium]|nr:hypothetical protein [Desulfobulbaceae bacterium]